MIGPRASRWTRLEQYARWRSGRLDPCQLPSEILALVCENLDIDSFTSLLHAIVGHRPRLHSPRDLFLVPAEMRFSWLMRRATRDLQLHLESWLPEAAKLARTCRGVHIFADWSPFAGKQTSECKLAEVVWYNDAAHMTIHPHAIHVCFRNAIDKYRPQVQLAMHRCIAVHMQRSVLAPRAVKLGCHALLPHFIIMSDFVKNVEDASPTEPAAPLLLRTRSKASKSRRFWRRRQLHNQI